MAEPTIAYLLKGYPRLSELFIASEISRLEQAGVPLRLFVLKHPDEQTRHAVVDRIDVRPEYLLSTASVSGTPFLAWLRSNLPPFLPALARVARRRPVGLSRALAAAVAQSVRARPSAWSAPRKKLAKELLQAVELADRLLADPRIRHLHAHFAHSTTTVAWLSSLITGLPFSFTGHAKDIYETALNPGGLLRRKLLAARFAVTCTEANLHHLKAFAPDAVVHLVYHGLNADLERLLASAPENPSRNGRLELLAVGRLVEKKGFDVLVEACRALRDRTVPFVATIVGEEGESSEAIRRSLAIHDLGGHVALPGPMAQAGLLEHYRRATAFCLPCRLVASGDRDGIPNVLVEAMACGVPVVTTGVSGIPELVENEVNGLLVPPDDAAALTEAILRLHHDPELAARLGRAGQVTVRERFDGSELGRRLAELFQVAA
ncbi:MAG: colanic acid biosynthesis glycosyltransferase WcaL [Thermoleophilia bacterium]|nr:colanic acid biosynthesis glycosyltransferase WcaL [Thermoleophilia bacterium]